MFLITDMLFATSASSPRHATFKKYFPFIFPTSIVFMPLEHCFNVLSKSFPLPAGMLPIILFSEPIIPFKTSFKFPSPPTEKTTHSLSSGIFLAIVLASPAFFVYRIS